MAKIAGPQFNNHAGFDCFVQAIFTDVEDFVRMKADPYWREVVAPDHENFADTTRSRYVGASIVELQRLIEYCSSMTTGWVEDHVINGKVVE